MSAKTSPSKTYDASASRLTDAALTLWMETEITGQLTEVPGVGDKTAEKLNDVGIHTTFQLFGKYLSLRGPGVDQQEHLNFFINFLEDAGCTKSYLNSQVQAVSERMNVGFAMPCAISDELATKSTTQMTEEKLAKFLMNDLTGNMKDDFHGVGPKSVAKMEAYGVHNTWQLIGNFLMTMDKKVPSETSNDDASSPINNAEAFEEWLKTVGTAASYRAAVVMQVVEKLACGLWLPGDRDRPDGFQVQMDGLSI
jgi:predicted flap endonuclease-1-like 5' DNA nuclease